MYDGHDFVSAVTGPLFTEEHKADLNFSPKQLFPNTNPRILTPTEAVMTLLCDLVLFTHKRLL